MSDFPIFRIFGEGAILLDWPARIDLEIHDLVLQYVRFVNENFSEEIRETVPTYHSIALFLNAEVDVSQFIQKLKHSEITPSEKVSRTTQLITVPVCYESQFAPDIDTLATAKGLSVSQVIDLHTSSIYKVYFLGFLPGFPYMGGLPTELHTLRKKVPNALVQKGSVGIGGAQTGIYTRDSPGGWQIIGRTPIQLFNALGKPPTQINAGDFVKFEAINKNEFDLIEIEIEADTFQWRKEAYCD
jgi:inhibitor of KinA